MHWQAPLLQTVEYLTLSAGYDDHGTPRAAAMCPLQIGIFDLNTVFEDANEDIVEMISRQVTRLELPV